MTVTDAFVAAILDDPAALDQLAEALAPRIAAVSTVVDTSAGLTTARAATRAGLHERTIRRALAAGTLTGQTIAGRWRIDADDLDQWLKVGAPTSVALMDTTGRARATGATAGADAIAGRKAA